MVGNSLQRHLVDGFLMFESHPERVPPALDVGGFAWECKCINAPVVSGKQGAHNHITSHDCTLVSLEHLKKK